MQRWKYFEYKLRRPWNINKHGGIHDFALFVALIHAQNLGDPILLDSNNL